jgi:hypothetical protein
MLDHCESNHQTDESDYALVAATKGESFAATEHVIGARAPHRQRISSVLVAATFLDDMASFEFAGVSTKINSYESKRTQ